MYTSTKPPPNGAANALLPTPLEGLMTHTRTHRAWRRYTPRKQYPLGFSRWDMAVPAQKQHSSANNLRFLLRRNGGGTVAKRHQSFERPFSGALASPSEIVRASTAGPAEGAPQAATGSNPPRPRPMPPQVQREESKRVGQRRPMQPLCDKHRPPPACKSCQGHRGVRHCCSRHHEGRPALGRASVGLDRALGGGLQLRQGTLLGATV